MRLLVGGVFAASAIALLAVSTLTQPAPPRRVVDTITTGMVVDAGAPLYAADPNGVGCAFGCGKVGVTPAAGSQVRIVCRTEQGYLKLDGQPARWVFAADVFAVTRPPDCGPFD
jgi:hypothetical protein